MLDFDVDGWPDLFVANDTQPNKLYRNRGNGTFQEVGVQAGLAFSEDGRARAGMGTDAADFDNSGVPSLVVTNFSGEMLGSTARSARRLRRSRARLGGRQGQPLTLGFGCFFFDADLDGLLDLLVVNGHIDDRVARTGRVNYAEPPHLFHNRGKGSSSTSRARWAPTSPRRRSGAARRSAIIDLDGDLDVLITTNGGPARSTATTSAGRASALTLRGVKSNRDGIGAHVRVKAGTAWQTRMVRTGSSYLSQSELPLTFGIPRRTVPTW